MSAANKKPAVERRNPILMKLNDKERKVLAALTELSGPDGEFCLSFAPLVRDTGLDRATVRRACRSLKRKGLAEFHFPLWTDEGEPAGAGYCVSRLGLEQEKEAPRCRAQM